jgi:hypothetical protein
VRRILPLGGIEHRKVLVTPKRGDAPEEYRRDNDGKDLASEHFFVRVKEVLVFPWAAPKPRTRSREFASSLGPRPNPDSLDCHRFWPLWRMRSRFSAFGESTLDVGANAFQMIVGDARELHAEEMVIRLLRQMPNDSSGSKGFAPTELDDELHRLVEVASFEVVWNEDRDASQADIARPEHVEESVAHDVHFNPLAGRGSDPDLLAPPIRSGHEDKFIRAARRGGGSPRGQARYSVTPAEPR